MKKAILLIFGILTAITAICQTYTLQDGTKVIATSETPWTLVNVATPKDIVFAPGITYKFVLIEVPNNTAGKTIKVSEVGGTTPALVLKETIDNTSARNAYSGQWTHAYKGPAPTPLPLNSIYNQAWTDPFENDNVTLSTTPGATLTFQFTGKKIEWIAEKRTNHQNVTIEIAGQTETVNLNQATTANGPSKVWEKTLSQGSYTLKITNSGTSVVHDVFKVYE